MFEVGQRVRIIKSLDPSRVGLETTIMSDLTNISDDGEPYSCDGVGHIIDLPHPYYPNIRSCYRPDCLEPIDDSNDLVSWESMKDLWLPRDIAIAEHIRAFCPTADEYRDV